MFASLDATQASFTLLDLVNANMAVEIEIHFSKNMLWAYRHTRPTGFALAGIQADILGFGAMTVVVVMG